MSEFHDDYPQYELMAHHSEEEGKKKRRKLWNVFWIMLIVTLVELFVGFKAADWGIKGTNGVKIFFILFTIVKAYFIVYAFMHLGDENKLFKWFIIGPYSVFALYLVYLTAVNEGSYVSARDPMVDPLIQMQRESERAGHGGSHDNSSHENNSEHKQGSEAGH